MALNIKQIIYDQNIDIHVDHTNTGYMQDVDESKIKLLNLTEVLDTIDTPTQDKDGRVKTTSTTSTPTTTEGSPTVTMGATGGAYTGGSSGGGSY